jgi:hypothetical protein
MRQTKNPVVSASEKSCIAADRLTDPVNEDPDFGALRIRAAINRNVIV